MNLLTSVTERLDGCDRQTGDDNALSQHLDLAKQKKPIYVYIKQKNSMSTCLKHFFFLKG